MGGTGVYADWKPSTADNRVTDSFDTIGGMSAWKSVKMPQTVMLNTWHKVRVWVDVPFNGVDTVSGKYNVAIKPTGVTMAQAEIDGTLLVVDPWYSVSWLYRKPITVTNASVNYQTKVKIGKTSGATGEDVDCGGYCQDDFDDIRFTASDGATLLDYWVESVAASGTSYLATVWVQNDATPSTTLYMYYGNSGAATASNGANTFILFDDFERGADGDTVGGSWTELAAHCHISTDHNFTYGGSRCEKMVGAVATPYMSIPLDTVNLPYAIRIRVWKEDADTNNRFGSHGNGTRRMNTMGDVNENILYYAFEGGAWGWQDTGKNMVADAWEFISYENIDFAGNSYDIYYQDDDTIAKAGAGMQDGASYDDAIAINGGGNTVGMDIYFDDLVVRKWLATPPTFAFGAQETVQYDIDNTPSATKEFNVIAANTTYYAYGTAPHNPVVSADCTYTVVNDGNVPINISILADNFTGGVGWTIGASVGVNTVKLVAYKAGDNPADTPTGDGVVLTNDGQAFIENLGVSDNITWDFSLSTGTFTDGVEKVGKITLTSTVY
jgi:hypothetical protein